MLAPELSLFETSLGRVCQEGLACEMGAGAEFYCQDCTTYQCSKCEGLLHSTRELKLHTRTNLHGNTDRANEVTTSSTIKQPLSSLPSFLLVDKEEKLMVSDKAEFVQRLGCPNDCKAKVVSIFGNTGDGKSHTLNHAFFNEENVFPTSRGQNSCTVGVWAAYSSKHNAIFIDSEGLLGVSENEHRRTRLLLKVLAVSDVVIYRTRAERLHNDLFTFLGDASDAYWKYFSPELKAASDRYCLDTPLSSLGPCVVIFHETLYTELLGEHACVTSDLSVSGSELTEEQMSSLKDSLYCDDDSPPQFFSTEEEAIAATAIDDEGSRRRDHQMTAEELLRIRFSELGFIPKAFSSVKYVGTRTQTPPTDFSTLCTVVRGLVDNNTVRSPRSPGIVYSALKVLNDKFSGHISNMKVSSFPDAYFTCSEKCLSCGARCECCMNHLKDGVPHKITVRRCKYSHHFDNKIYLCKSCFDRGVESVVSPETVSSGDSGWMGLAKYAWAGYVIECPQCGIIYRSRQHWYGNKEPEAAAVKTDNKHIWPQDFATGPGSENVARRLLDRVGGVAEVVGIVSAQPARSISSWMSDQIAPKYWTPNAKILVCGECQKEFGSSDTKHHCRACGGGFCEKCSSKYMAVPWRGWGNVPVRVCLSCYKQTQGKQSPRVQKRSTQSEKTAESENNVTARYMGEVVQSAIGLMAGAMSYPKDFIVESARPTYWVSDSLIKRCHKCKRDFGPGDSKHHCRACGEGFCSSCSSHQVPVPSRGWDHPVRVCDLCIHRRDL